MTTETAARLAERRIRESLAVQERLVEEAMLGELVRAAETIAASLRAGGKLLVFGNGGSAADATHIAAELVGRFLLERQGLPALSLSDNGSAVTAIANDYGYARVFARQVEALGNAGDVALGISTSGRSDNVVDGLQAARARGLATLALTGGDAGRMPEVADVCIVVPSAETPRVQEGHTLVAHILCELIELSIS
jgi:D-sedoheptulose 7-phosphate isomerase